jgi:hypothetical protein
LVVGRSAVDGARIAGFRRWMDCSMRSETSREVGRPPPGMRSKGRVRIAMTDREPGRRGNDVSRSPKASGHAHPRARRRSAALRSATLDHERLRRRSRTASSSHRTARLAAHSPHDQRSWSPEQVWASSSSSSSSGSSALDASASPRCSAAAFPSSARAPRALST